jgi:hypothetical protein
VAKTLYHVTFSSSIPSIARRGLQPSEDPWWGGDLGDKSYGKVFMASRGHALYYGLLKFRQVLEGEDLAPIPIVLRLPASEVKGCEIDPGDRKSVYTCQTVPPRKIQGRWHGAWKALPYLSRFVDEEMYVRWSDEFGEYIDWEGAPIGTSVEDAVRDVRRLTR